MSTKQEALFLARWAVFVGVAALDSIHAYDIIKEDCSMTAKSFSSLLASKPRARGAVIASPLLVFTIAITIMRTQGTLNPWVIWSALTLVGFVMIGFARALPKGSSQ